MHKVITLPEGGRGVRILMAFLFCAYKAVHLKEQPYLHPDGDLVGITFTPPLPHTNLGELCEGDNCINLSLVSEIGRMIQNFSHFYFSKSISVRVLRGGMPVVGWRRS